MEGLRIADQVDGNTAPTIPGSARRPRTLSGRHVSAALTFS